MCLPRLPALTLGVTGANETVVVIIVITSCKDNHLPNRSSVARTHDL